MEHRINADVPEKLLWNLKLCLQSLKLFKGWNLKEGEEIPRMKLDKGSLLIWTSIQAQLYIGNTELFCFAVRKSTSFLWEDHN